MSETLSADSKHGSCKGAVILKAIKFIFISYLVSVILLAILAAVIVYTDVPGEAAAPSVKAVTLFGTLLSGFMMSFSIERRGWLYGFIIGLVNIIILLLAGMLIFGSGSVNMHTIIMLLCGGLCGAFGAIVGMNIRK